MDDWTNALHVDFETHIDVRLDNAKNNITGLKHNRKTCWVCTPPTHPRPPSPHLRPPPPGPALRSPPPLEPAPDVLLIGSVTDEWVYHDGKVKPKPTISRG